MTRTEGAAPSADELAILRLINRWIVYRDSGDWVRLRTIWHEDGTIRVGWREGQADDFIAASKAGWNGKLKVLHALGAVEVEVNGNRAISQNKIGITMRGDIEGILCDLTCMARHLDRWEKRAGLWGLAARETIYDRDRFDAVVPSEIPKLDLALLNTYCEGYRHTAYMLIKLGYEISPSFPALGTAEGDALMNEWRAWLS